MHNSLSRDTLGTMRVIAKHGGACAQRLVYAKMIARAVTALGFRSNHCAGVPCCMKMASGSQRWKSKYNIIKAPGLPYKTYHPHVQEPERTIQKVSGSLEGPVRYVPKNFRHKQYIESIRSGEYLGPDWPFNCLGTNFWKARRYNVTYNPLPPDLSAMTGVQFHARLNIWSAQWWEKDRQRFLWFRCQTHGFMQAKLSAESFRRTLVEAGRVDNRRTRRQILLQRIAGQAERNLLKGKFKMKDARRRGNSGSKLGPERKVRRDYQRRGLLP